MRNFAINKVAGPQFADANEEVVYRSATQKSPHSIGSDKKACFAEGFLGQTKERVRSLLDVSEELAL